jgi:malate synthase
MTHLDISAPDVEGAAEVLTPDALDFVVDLHRRFVGRRDELLARRRTRRSEIARGGRLGFLTETGAVRAGDWRVAPAPADLQDRRVEITGPTSRKMAVNALNSGAQVWLADLEDANTPHWRHAQEVLGIPYGPVRATVLIETIPAAFEMEEILCELRDHASGLNAGRWDYLFSIIKTFRDVPGTPPLPDRGAVTMTAPMMAAYSDLLVRTCHTRGAHAIGGMAAFIPSRRDEEVDAKAFAKVREDKSREAASGFDGSWVAHPDLVPLCREVFDEVLVGPNQVHRTRDDVSVGADDLLALDRRPGDRTPDGLRANVHVGIAYLAAWLSGNGAAAIDNLMEDAATAEISRSQIWQWLHSGVSLSDGRVVDRELVDEVVRTERERLGADGWHVEHLDTATELFRRTALDDDFVDFLTVPAYDSVLAAGG